jgi:hypothetical protein
LLQNKYAEALGNFNTALSYAKEMGIKNEIKEAYNSLSTVYEKLDKHNESFVCYKQFIIYRNLLNNEENTAKAIQTQMLYDFDKKENEDNLEKEKEKAIAEEISVRKNFILVSMVVGLVLVLMFSFFIYNRYRLAQKQKIIIESQKVTVENQKHLAEEKQKEILDSIRYARRIQRALITNEKYIQKHLSRLISE